MKEWKNKNSGNSSNKKGKNSSNQSNTTMDLKKARIRFIEIANKTGIHGEKIIKEPNPQERDELWDITRSFLTRIYALDDKSNLSKEELAEYHELCYWSIAALHWNDYFGKSPAQHPGRFRRDTIALALCLYIRISKDYELHKNIEEEFIMPHAKGSVILWICSEMKIAERDIYFDKFDIEFIKKADEQRKKYFFDRGGLFLNKEDNEKDYDKIVEILYELLDTFYEEDGRSFSKFILTYIKTLKELLPEDLENNTKYIESTLLSSSTPESTEDQKEKEALEKLGTTKKDLAEKVLKSVSAFSENPAAHDFVKAVSAKDAVMQDIIDEHEDVFEDYIDFADEDGYTAMHYACWDNKLLIVEMLIDFGANPNVVSPTNETPLNMAVVSGHFDVVKFFVDYDVEMELNIEWEKRNTTPNPFHPEKGSTLIRDAILNQHWDIVDLLINGIAPNLDVLTEPCSVGFEGETNFFLAIEKLFQKENIDYDKERLETIRSTVEGSSNKETNNEEDEQERTGLDRMVFVLLAFAHLTDKNIAEEEAKEIHSVARSLLGDGYSVDKVQKAFDWYWDEMEKVEWNGDDIGFQEIVNQNVKSAGNLLKKTSSLPQRRLFINQVIGIANADGNISKNEIGWIERLCKEIDVEIPNILDEDPERRWDVEEEDDNKGYPMITVRNFKDKNGNNDTEKQKLVSKYMSNWQEKTEDYSGRMGITARIPDFFQAIDKNCPKWTSDEITNIKNYIATYKVIPTLRYAPEEFNSWTKQVWWLAPFVFVEGPEGEIASWLFIDKNGFYVAHPSDNDGTLIFNWDIINDMDTDWLEDNLVMLTLYGEHNDQDIELRICEFVSEGNGSYLEVIESIHSVYEKTIEASRGGSTWSHGAGGEGYEGFDNPKELLDENKWKAVEPTNPSLYGSSFEEIKTVDQKENGSNTKEVDLKTENKTLSKDASIWEIIQHEFINLDKESVVKKDFSEMILKKYPHIKKGTLGAQISIQVINKRGRTNYAQCSKERVCGDNKYDFLFENDDKTLCKYDKGKHGIWEIYKREDGKLDVRIHSNE